MDKRICAIVGAGPGLGLALAKRFGRERFVIVFVSRRPETRKGYVRILQDEGMEAFGIAADPADGQSLKHAFELIKQRLGPPEVLIYNATTRGPHPMLSMINIENLNEDFRINVTSGLLCAQLVIPDMRAKRNGTIFFTAGGYGSRTELPFTGLAMGKACVRILSNSLGLELASSGIHVATVFLRRSLQTGTRFDPDRVADEYWKLYIQEPGYEKQEIIYD